MPWEKVKNIGWTKLKDLAPVLTKENVDSWVKVAEQQTAIQLVETVKAAVAANSPKAIEDQTAKTLTTKTFKVHEDQKATIDLSRVRTHKGQHYFSHLVMRWTTKNGKHHTETLNWGYDKGVGWLWLGNFQ